MYMINYTECLVVSDKSVQAQINKSFIVVIVSLMTHVEWDNITGKEKGEKE